MISQQEPTNCKVKTTCQWILSNNWEGLKGYKISHEAEIFNKEDTCYKNHGHSGWSDNYSAKQKKVVLIVSEYTESG